MADNDIKKQQLFTWKLRNDRLWYMENFLKIRDKQSRLVPFKPNYAQRMFNDIIEKNTKLGKPHRYIILKARQLGISTFTEAYIYHDTSTRENVNSLIIAHEEKATLNLFNMSRLFYESCPLAIRPMKKYSNGKELVFENPTTDDEEKLRNPGLRSKITIATAGTTDTARSGTYHNVHVSEIAFFPNPQNTMTALLQCVPDEPNTFVCMESTANGIGGYFYDMWNAAVRGENDFTPIFFPWFTDPSYSTPFETEEEKEEFIKSVNYMHPDASGKLVHTDEWLLKEQFNLTWEQLNWRRKTIANKCGGDLDMFHQEYPSTPEEAFIASGRPKFNLKSVKEYELRCQPPEVVGDLLRTRETISINENDKGPFKMWLAPQKDTQYVIGADVAEGLVSGDYSVAIVLDNDLNVCAKWRGHTDPDLFGKEIVKLAMLYNEAYVAVENNNHGLTTLKSILNEDYYNLFYTKIYDKVNDTITKKLGWSTNARTKPLAIDKLAEYIRERFFGMWDIDIIEELYSYVIDDKGRTNAQEGKYDDCVMALAIALQAFLEGRGEDYLPEISRDDVARYTKKQLFDIPEIIDELFESDNIKEEYSE
jgi:hypothetical protein